MTKDDIPPTLPDEWLSFYMWALGEAEYLSEGAPETQLITQDGEHL